MEMYRTVKQLTKDEKDELKGKLYYGCEEYIELSDKEKDIIDNALCAEDIPDYIVESAFSIYEFVEDDFFCNT